MKAMFRSLLAGACVALVPALLHAAPVTINSQDRSIHILISPTADDPTLVDESTAAPDNAPFSESLSGSHLNGGAHANAQQTSSFGESGDLFAVNADGAASYDSSEDNSSVAAASGFQLVFTLNDTRQAALTFSGTFLDSSAGASGFSMDFSGPSGELLSLRSDDFKENNDEVRTLDISQTFTLEPGQYTLFGAAAVGGPINDLVPASFSITFSAQDGATAIPLPAAALPGALMLAGVVGRTVRRRIART